MIYVYGDKGQRGQSPAHSLTFILIDETNKCLYTYISFSEFYAHIRLECMRTHPNMQERHTCTTKCVNNVHMQTLYTFKSVISRPYCLKRVVYTQYGGLSYLLPAHTNLDPYRKLYTDVIATGSIGQLLLRYRCLRNTQ